MTDEKEPSGAITSLSFGPRIAPDAHVVHYETDDGATGYARLRRPEEGAPLLPGERILDMHGYDERGRIRTIELYRHGPAQVATALYRSGWDVIFSKKTN
jgi:hypothetical protein